MSTIEKKKSEICDKEEERKPLPLEKVDCPYCQSKEYSVLYQNIKPDLRGFDIPETFRDQEFSFVTCLHCGLVYLKERPAQADLHVYYDNYRLHKKMPTLLGYAYDYYDRIYFRSIKKHIQNKSNIQFLDYGCGSGKRIKHFQTFEPSWKYIATDFSTQAMTELEGTGIEKYSCSELNIKDYVPENTCDIITGYGILEHTAQPQVLLQTLYDILKPNGVLLMMIPNIDSWDRPLLKEIWWNLHTPCHFTIFTEKVLRKMSGEIGFEVLEIKNELQSSKLLASDIQTILNRKYHIPEKLLNVLHVPFAMLLLPLEYIQTLRGKSLANQTIILKKIVRQ